ncbi:MAG: hypothetical protein AVDCRST_MAG11-3750, partial [uncultured Gemmatimonadaceae bacterium]
AHLPALDRLDPPRAARLVPRHHPLARRDRGGHRRGRAARPLARARPGPAARAVRAARGLRARRRARPRRGRAAPEQLQRAAVGVARPRLRARGGGRRDAREPRAHRARPRAVGERHRPPARLARGRRAHAPLPCPARPPLHLRPRRDRAGGAGVDGAETTV